MVGCGKVWRGVMGCEEVSGGVSGGDGVVMVW